MKYEYKMCMKNNDTLWKELGIQKGFLSHHGSLIYDLICVTTLTYHRNRQCGPLVWCDASVFDLYSFRVSIPGNG